MMFALVVREREGRFETLQPSFIFAKTPPPNLKCKSSANQLAAGLNYQLYFFLFHALRANGYSNGILDSSLYMLPKKCFDVESLNSQIYN